MSQELKERIENLISYYEQHDMEKMVNGEDQRLRNFVTDDFKHLLAKLEKEL